MARAENQGLQIALIVFVMLTIILAVVTFLYVRNFQEATAANQQLTKSAADAKKISDSAEGDLRNIKDMLGVDQNMTIDNVKKTFDEDMKQFAATLPADKQHYHDALESLWDSNRELDGQKSELSSKLTQLEDQFKRREEERDAQIQKFAKTAEDQANDTLAERNKFADQRQKSQQDQDEYNARAAKAETDVQNAKSIADRDRQTAATEIKTLATANHIKDDKIRDLRTSEFEVAEGAIVSVYARQDTLTINIGSADLLWPLVTFSVHDAGANTAQGDGLKGRIEVQEILGDHLARARILEQDFANPIAPGDKIYTPLWHRGQATHFAIVGKIDLNADGEDDRELVKSVIAANKGVIDAEMDVLGKITGKINENTRYLIEGDIGNERQAIENKKIMGKDADQWGVERITAKRFFEFAGWKWDQRQVIKFGRNGTRERIPPDIKDGSNRAATPIGAANFESAAPIARPPRRRRMTQSSNRRGRPHPSDRDLRPPS